MIRLGPSVFSPSWPEYLPCDCVWQTDKASMLDEAIEYLKMLQLQLQVFVLHNAFHQLVLQNVW